MVSNFYIYIKRFIFFIIILYIYLDNYSFYSKINGNMYLLFSTKEIAQGGTSLKMTVKQYKKKASEIFLK